MTEQDDAPGTEQRTEHQHYVPRFYLKRFADPKNFLQVLDVKAATLRPARPYASVCYGSYFYAAKTGEGDDASQQIERWLKFVEDYVARNLQYIIDKIYMTEPITSADKYVLSVLCSMLWIRGPVMRRQINRLHEDMMKQINRMVGSHMVDAYVAETGAAWSEEKKRELKEFMQKGEYSLEFGNEQHLRFMVESLGLGGEGFANLFHYQKWRIYIARGKRRFITSDNPLVEWFPPVTGFFGYAFPEREHYLALTPDILLHLTTPQGSTKVKRIHLYESDDATVMMYNYLIGGHSHAFAYSPHKALLNDMISGITHPGVAERMYFDRYVRPHHEKPSS